VYLNAVCKTHMYRVTGRWLRNAAYETITNYLMSNLSMNGVTAYC